MGDEPGDPIARNGEADQPKSESDQIRPEYVRTELALSFLLARVAEDEYQTGKCDSDRSLARAEDGYSALVSFLSDVNRAYRITDEDRRELEEGMARLRTMLDVLWRKMGRRP